MADRDDTTIEINITASVIDTGKIDHRDPSLSALSGTPSGVVNPSGTPAVQDDPAETTPGGSGTRRTPAGDADFWESVWKNNPEWNKADEDNPTTPDEVVQNRSASNRHARSRNEIDSQYGAPSASSPTPSSPGDQPPDSGTYSEAFSDQRSDSRRSRPTRSAYESAVWDSYRRKEVTLEEASEDIAEYRSLKSSHQVTPASVRQEYEREQVRRRRARSRREREERRREKQGNTLGVPARIAREFTSRAIRKVAPRWVPHEAIRYAENVVARQVNQLTRPATSGGLSNTGQVATGLGRAGSLAAGVATGVGAIGLGVAGGLAVGAGYQAYKYISAFRDDGKQEANPGQPLMTGPKTLMAGMGVEYLGKSSGSGFLTGLGEKVQGAAGPLTAAALLFSGTLRKLADEGITPTTKRFTDLAQRVPILGSILSTMESVNNRAVRELHAYSGDNPALRGTLAYQGMQRTLQNFRRTEESQPGELNLRQQIQQQSQQAFRREQSYADLEAQFSRALYRVFDKNKQEKMTNVIVNINKLLETSLIPIVERGIQILMQVFDLWKLGVGAILEWAADVVPNLKPALRLWKKVGRFGMILMQKFDKDPPRGIESDLFRIMYGNNPAPHQKQNVFPQPQQNPVKPAPVKPPFAI